MYGVDFESEMSLSGSSKSRLAYPDKLAVVVAKVDRLVTSDYNIPEASQANRHPFGVTRPRQDMNRIEKQPTSRHPRQPRLLPNQLKRMISQMHSLSKRIQMNLERTLDFDLVRRDLGPFVEVGGDFLAAETDDPGVFEVDVGVGVGAKVPEPAWRR